MIKLVRPFRLVQPPRHLAHLVASRSYLSYNQAELTDKLDRNPFSYLQVVNPDSKVDIEAKRGTSEYFKEVRKGYDRFIRQGWFEGTDGPGYAIYRQITPEATFIGIIAVLDLHSCESGALLTHELTIERRVSLFANYMENVGFHAEPILCARKSGHLGEEKLNRCISEIVAQREANCDFSTTDRIRHSIWWVNPEIDSELSIALEPLNQVYLADGHHRLSSSIKMMQRRPNEPGTDRILAYIIPAKDLRILGYHREIQGWNGDMPSLINNITSEASVEKVEEIKGETEPCKGCIDIISNKGTWRVFLRENGNKTQTDAGWLEEFILESIFNYKDKNSRYRVKYVPGSFKSNILKERLADHDDKVIFALHPIAVEQIIAVADAGKTLPPKSTWVEPKLRSGLFVYEFGMHPHDKEY